MFCAIELYVEGDTAKAKAAFQMVVDAVLAYFYRGHLLSAYHWIVEGTGSNTAAVLTLALALIVLFLIILWLLFPLIVCLGIASLRRHTLEAHRFASWEEVIPTETETPRTGVIAPAIQSSEPVERTPGSAGPPGSTTA